MIEYQFLNISLRLALRVMQNMPRLREITMIFAINVIPNVKTF